MTENMESLPHPLRLHTLGPLRESHSKVRRNLHMVDEAGDWTLT